MDGGGMRRRCKAGAPGPRRVFLGAMVRIIDTKALPCAADEQTYV
jgi:hypothetical protein